MVGLNANKYALFHLMFPKAAGVVPHWIQLCVVRGEMTSCILDVLRLRSRSLSPCVGSATLYDSAHQTSKPLRQVMYGLLSPQLDPPMEVVERDRVGLNLTESRVQAVIPAAIMDLPLASLPEVAELPCRNTECLSAISGGPLNCSMNFCTSDVPLPPGRSPPAASGVAGST